MKKKIFTLLLLLITVSTVASKVYAQEEFETEFSVTYDVAENGETSINQNISIINKSNELLATNYSLTIKQMEIYSIYGEDTEGELEVEVEKEKDSTTIATGFNAQVVGEGRAINFNLDYKTRDVATEVGEIWNVHIPKVDTLELTRNYDVILKVPKIFGPEIFISPEPFLIEENSLQRIYTFNKDSLFSNGITASFGKYQLINYNLKYHLVNPNNITSQMEIALPPDILDRQQVKVSSISPKPLRVYNDTDGNTLALFQLIPGEEKNIEVTGSVRITGKQIQPDFGGSFGEIPQELLNLYTGEDTYWEVSSEEIQKLATSLKDHEATVAQNARYIYEYITSNLEYDFDITEKEFVERSGALKALNSKGAWACMEFTDLFISTARAMGIPARELDGFAFARENSVTPLSINIKGGDLLHAWPEFYDPVFGWVAIDPTWGNTSGIDYFTKLDTNHFVFVIKGIDSEYPLPAGTYKLQGDGRQVEVDFAQDSDDNTFEETLFLYEAKTLNPIKRLKGKKKYFIKNEGSVAIFNLQNTGEKLVPFAITQVYLDSDTTKVTYETFDKKEITKELLVKEGSPHNYSFSKTYIYILIGLVLALCVIFYVVINHLEALKKLVHHLYRHLRGQGQ